MNMLISVLSMIFFISFYGMMMACGSSKSSSPQGPTPALDAAGENHEKEGGDELRVSSTKGLFQVEVNWSPNLVAGTIENSALVHFHNPAGDHIPAVLKRFKLYMTTMGHGSIKENELTLTEEEPGHWLVKNIYFSMPGASTSWVVDIEAELEGQTDTARVVIDAEVH